MSFGNMAASYCISLSGWSMWALIALDRLYRSHAEPSRTLSDEEQDCLSHHMVHVLVLEQNKSLSSMFHYIFYFINLQV